MVIFTSSDLAPNGNLIMAIFPGILTCAKFIHCKKGIPIFLSPAGMPLPKLFLVGNNWLVTSQLGTGKSLTFFYSVATVFSKKFRRM
jgi:hypothetical protein